MLEPGDCLPHFHYSLPAPDSIQLALVAKVQLEYTTHRPYRERFLAQRNSATLERILTGDFSESGNGANPFWRQDVSISTGGITP